MHKPTLLAIACFYFTITTAQKTDSITIYYRSDQYAISNEGRETIERFLKLNWDKLSIKSYTDETNDDEYNYELSRNRAMEVYELLLNKNITSAAINVQYFGEKIQLGDKTSEEGRSMNRRTVIIGKQYVRIPPRPVRDPNIPVTTTLDNGFIITYRPGQLSGQVLENFQSGSGSNFQLITNTTEMRYSNLYNNTTTGQILSSVLVVCGRSTPCQLDSPILVKIPVPNTKCPLDKVKFYVAVQRRGVRIWEEKSKELKPETINGRTYIALWVDNFCECINFDFEIDNGCFDIDSARLMMVNNNIKNLSSEIRNFNSLYMPRMQKDSAFSILFEKKDGWNGNVSFTLHNGKRTLKNFSYEPVRSFPYDSSLRSYVLSTDTLKVYFPRVKNFSMLLKVNRDRYRSLTEKDKCEFIYLNRHNENITADIYSTGKRKRLVAFKNIPVASIPLDPITGYRMIDKKFLKALADKKRSEERKVVASL